MGFCFRVSRFLYFLRGRGGGGGFRVEVGFRGLGHRVLGYLNGFRGSGVAARRASGDPGHEARNLKPSNTGEEALNLLMLGLNP